MKNILVIIFFFSTVLIQAQKKYQIFPDNLMIQPFVAKTIEPRLGFNFKINNNELGLNIGNSLDIFRMNLDKNRKISFGADLFTFTLLRGEKHFHFPVDAIDYLFGVNFGYLEKTRGNSFGFRMRISHISAHFVDGHFDGTHHQWRNGQNPRVYSREFVEFMPFYSFNYLRIYSGITYIFHVDPSNIGKDAYEFGFDYFLKGYLGKYFTPFVAYDLKVTHLYKYVLNHSLYFGIKYGKPKGKGVSLFFNYYNGNSFRGQYFNFIEKYSAVGINLDL